jgi:hypothetical protein
MKINKKGGVKNVGENIGENIAFTIGDRNVYTGTRQKLANKPYLDRVIYLNSVKIDNKSMINR